MKERYEAPRFSFLPFPEGVSGEDVAAMSDEELEALVKTIRAGMAERRYCVSEAFLLREIAGESVLMPLGGAAAAGEIGLPNETYRYILSLFQTPHTLREAIDQAKAEFDDPDGVMEEDIRNCVEEAVQLGIMEEKA